MSLAKWAASVQQSAGDANKLWTFGEDYFGEQGQNTSFTDRDALVQVGGLSWKQVVSTDFGVNAIRSDGTLWAWGSNVIANTSPAIQLGPLGINEGSSSASRSSPVQIGTSSWTQLAAGDNTIYGITKDSTLFVWGLISSGQGGKGDTIGGFPQQSWISVGVGASHCVAVRSDGTLWAWGYNGFGRLGTNDAINRLSPVQIGTDVNWMQAAAGDSASSALKVDGSLWTWGYSTWGSLGLNDVSFRSSPVQVGTSSWTQVSMRGDTTFAIRVGGALFAWGYNGFGCLGLNDIIHRSSPVQVGTSSWTQVCTHQRDYFAAAIRSDGALFTWGSNSNGQLGLNDVVNRSSPVQVGTSSWTQVTLTDASTAAIRTDGALFTWGGNVNGELGSNTVGLKRSSPVQVGTSSWTQIAAGYGHFYGITTANKLFTWGLNSNGQLGDGNVGAAYNTRVPIEVGSTIAWTKVMTGGYYYSAATSSDNKLYIWGDNTYGQQGNLGIESNRVPVPLGQVPLYISPVQIGTSSWTQVSAGPSYAAAIRSDGGLFVWGGVYGKDGTGGLANLSSPVQVGAAAWKKVSIGPSHGLAIKNDDTLWGWGYPTYNAIPVATPLSWKSIQSNDSAGGAIRSDGALFTWGYNFYGQLGDNTVASKYSPTRIGTSSWTALSIGVSHMAAIRSDGALFTWGYNGSGALGLNDRVNRSSPVQVGTSSWTQVSARGPYMLALRTDGAMFAWGTNSNGQLGTGDFAARSSPVQVGTSSWTQVAASTGGYSAAIRIDGALFLWGDNFYGQQGQNNIINTSVPTQLGTSSWTQVALSSGATYAITASTRQLFVWGYNLYGQLGQNDRVNRSSPVQVLAPAFGSWAMVSAGGNVVAAIVTPNNTTYPNTLWLWGQGSDMFGVTNSAHRSSPVQLGDNRWAGVDVGSNAVIAQRLDDTLYAWGYGLNGGLAELGQSSPVSRSSPVQVGTMPATLSITQIGSSTWKDVAVGNNYSVAVNSSDKLFHWGRSPAPLYTYTSYQIGNGSRAAARSDGHIFVWGNNTYGQLMTGSTAFVSVPTVVPRLGFNNKWTNVYLGEDFMFARGDALHLYAAGRNNYGQLGRGDTIDRSSPVQILSSGSLGLPQWDHIEILNGSFAGTVAGIVTNGKTLFTWGSGSTGILGINTSGDRSSPTQVGTSSWAIVVGNINSAAAITIDGALFTWGRNTDGELGLGDQAHRSSPTQVGTSSWTQVSVGYAQTIAIKADGSLWGWGYQMRNGSNINRSSPVQIGTDTDWAKVAAGGSYSHAIKTDQSLWGWGQGPYGTIGTGAVNISIPEQVGSGKWSYIGKTANLIVPAIDASGGMWNWGAIDTTYETRLTTAPIYQFSFHQIPSAVVWPNEWGSISNPTQIGTDDWSSVSAVDNLYYGINKTKGLYAWGETNALASSGMYVSSPVQVGVNGKAIAATRNGYLIIKS